MRASRLAVLIVLAFALAGCGGSAARQNAAPTPSEEVDASELDLRLEGRDTTDFRRRSVPLDEFRSG